MENVMDQDNPPVLSDSYSDGGRDEDDSILAEINTEEVPVGSGESEWIFQESAENENPNYEYSSFELPSASLDTESLPYVIKLEPSEYDYDPDAVADTVQIPNSASTLGLFPSVDHAVDSTDTDQEYVELDNRRLVIELEPLDPELIKLHTKNQFTKAVKRRGRPPKSVKTIKRKPRVERRSRIADDLEYDPLQDQSIELEDSPQGRVKQLKPVKIRIRLGKNNLSKSKTCQPGKKISSDPTDTFARKRGRPKKTITYHEDTENVAAPHIKLDIQKQIPVKRKPVRSKKVPLTDHEQEVVRTRVKKKRKSWKYPTAPNPDGPNPPQIGPCLKCQFKFHTEEELSSHPCQEFYELPNGRFQCGHCEKSLSRKKEMPSHLRIHTGEKPFKCKYCDMRFKDHRNRRVHERSKQHENQLQFQCSDCSKSFTSSAGLVAHVKIHGEKRYFCTFPGCDKGCFSKVRLNYHESRHSGEKVDCPTCGVGIFKPNHHRHQRRCERKKAKADALAEPYKDMLTVIEHQNGIFTCSLCRLQFKSEFSYVAHDCCKFCKLGENVWRCGVCLKIKKISFTDMKHHMKYHSPEKHFKCNQCGKGFRYESERSRHVAAHGGMKKFLCQTCGASYTSKQRFVLHLKAKHPEIPPESVVPILRRPGGGRLREKQRMERLGYQKRKRGPNRKTLVQTPGDASRSSASQQSSEQDRQPVLANTSAPVSHSHSASHTTHFQAPLPSSISSAYQPHHQPQLLQQQAYAAYPSVPPRQILPDPREWNWQWQSQGQTQTQSYPAHSHYHLYQYLPQQTVPPNEIYNPSGPSSASSGSIHAIEDSNPGGDVDSQGQPVDIEVEPDFESLPYQTDDWQEDDVEDPWESAFVVEKSPKKSKRTDQDAPITTTREVEVLPKLDLCGLFTKIARKEWQCNECSRISNRRSQMVSHCRVHTGSKPFSCTECDHKFKDKRNLNIHMRVHSGSKPYQCPVCFLRFRHNAPFNVHKRSHGDLLLTAPPLPKPPPREKAKKEKSHLPKIRQVTPNYLSHYLTAKEILESIDDDLPFRCSLCIQTYETEAEMSEHDCPRFAPLENGWWKCGVCSKIFKRKSEMKSHRAVHQDIYEFVCDQCGKAFKGKRSMTRHQAKTHLKIVTHKVFHCSICSKEFTTKYNKDIHERKHKQEMPFLCSICAMGFYDKQSYRHHMERHEAGGPTFKCKICNTEVTTKYELCLHSKTHGIMPKYRCRKKVPGSDPAIPTRTSKKTKTSKEAKSVPSIKIKISGQSAPVIKEEPNSSDSESSEESDSDYSENQEDSDVEVNVRLNRVTRSRRNVGV